MKTRLDYGKVAPGIYDAMDALDQYIGKCGLEESLLHSDRERAALAWTEAVTRITDGHAADEVHEQARTHFSEKELSDLTLAVAAINAWNRLSIAARLVPGNYQPSPVAK